MRSRETKQNRSFGERVLEITSSQEMAVSGNDTSASHEQGGIEKHDEGFKIGIVVCLSIAAVVGFLGNGLVVAVILRAKKMRSVMNRFILHLAISDLIVSVLAIPMFLVINFKEDIASFGYSLPLCKIGRFFQYLSPEASMTLLITIGWNRHQAVVHPLNIMSYRTANKLILAAWIYALLAVAPSLYLTTLKETPVDPITNQSSRYCATIPATTLSGLVYVMFLGLFGYLIPLASLIILYAKIYLTVWRRKSGQLGDSRPVEAFIRSRKKVLKMFLTVIFVFLVTWLPLLIYISAIEWTVKKTTSHVDYVRLITYSLGLCNSICNPFIYALFNAKFRAGCKEMFRVSINAVRRKPKSPRGAGANVSPVTGRTDVRTRQAMEEPQNVLSRRGGFHGTKGGDEKKNQNKESQKKEETKPNSVSFGQLIGRRFRSLTDVDAYKDGSTEAVQLVGFQKTADAEQVVLHLPNSSLEKSRPLSNSKDNCVKFADEVSCQSNGMDAHENRSSAGDTANGKVEKSRANGYSILQEEASTPTSTPIAAKKRTRSEGDRYTQGRTNKGFPEYRIRSMPPML